ncbi:M23 family peptidase, partial [Streptomyces sp. TRM76130]|nr:M23 family peptidase [Streptomyces sp. TRM76130]
MASNRPAPEAPFVPNQPDPATFGYGAVRPDEGPLEEWNPTADTVRPVRGRHRVAKQRGGLARSSTVLGVGVIAAVGAGGMASAQTGKPPVSISLPDLPSVGSIISAESAG